MLLVNTRPAAVVCPTTAESNTTTYWKTYLATRRKRPTEGYSKGLLADIKPGPAAAAGIGVNTKWICLLLQQLLAPRKAGRSSPILREEEAEEKGRKGHTRRGRYGARTFSAALPPRPLKGPSALLKDKGRGLRDWHDMRSTSLGPIARGTLLAGWETAPKFIRGVDMQYSF